MVRAACCEKKNVKRGPWSSEEDRILISHIYTHGHGNWRALPKLAGLKRCGKSCRLRWVNYLRPDIKRGNFSREEEVAIISLHRTFGNKWSAIAARLPGRTDNEIKNVWHTHIKKKLVARDNTAAAAAAAAASSSEETEKKENPSVSSGAAVDSENTAASSITSVHTIRSSQHSSSDSVFSPDSPSVVSGDRVIPVNGNTSDEQDDDQGTAGERSFGSLENIFPENIDEAAGCVFSWLEEEEDDGAALPMDFTDLEVPSSPLMVDRVNHLMSSSDLPDDMDFWLQVFMGSTALDDQ